MVGFAHVQRFVNNKLINNDIYALAHTKTYWTDTGNLLASEIKNRNN